MSRSLRALLVVSLALTATWIIISACDDKPTEPPPPPEPKDYPVFISDGGGSGAGYLYYTYYSRTGELDTLSIGSTGIGYLAVSTDGRRLYVAYASLTIVVDIETQDTIATLPYPNSRGIAVSPDNRYVALQGNVLTILDVDDYSVLFQDATKMRGGSFSSDGSTFYAARNGAAGSYVYRLSLDSLSVTEKLFPYWQSRGIRQVRTSADESLWFLYQYGLEVYDVEQDSIIFADHLNHGTGSVEVTPNGRYVLYTDGYAELGGVGTPLLGFKVYNVERNEIDMVVSTVGVADGERTTNMVPDDFFITPDGRYAVFDNAISVGWRDFIVFDISQMQISKYVNVPGAYFRNPACQNGL